MMTLLRQIGRIKLTLGCVVLCLGGLVAQTLEIPAGKQFDLLLKALSFDTALKPKKDNRLQVTIVYQKDLKESAQALDEIQDLVKNSPDKSVHGYRVCFTGFDLKDPEALDSLVRADSLDAIYVLPLRAIDIRKIATIGKEHKVHTLTAVPNYVFQGLSMGVRKKGDGAEIIFNLQALTDEGAEFPLRVLKLGTVVHQ